jgi:flagellar biosynthetic protein FliO
MAADRRPAAPRRQMAHRAGRPVTRRAALASPRRLGLGIGATLLAGVAIVGLLNPTHAAGSGPDAAASSATAAPSAAASIVGSAWGGTGGMDLLDLITKGGLVLILLFVTLRVLGRMQAANPNKGGRLDVLESRPLAAKASLHLVAVGDRRLVVGLTPNGMVALAEMDAAELEAAELAKAARATAGATAGATSGATAGATPGATAPVGLPFASVLAPLLAPIDRATDRVAGFIAGSRAR